MNETKETLKRPQNTVFVNTDRLWNKYYIVIMVINFVANVSFYLISSTLSTHSIGLGATQTLAGIIVGFFSIVSLVARPFSGIITNRISSSILLVTSFLLMASSAFGYAFIQLPPLFIPIRIIHGIGFSINGVVTMVLISKIIPKNHLTKGMAYFGISQVFASAVGPTAGSALGQLFGYRYSFLAAGFTLVLAAVIVLIFPLPETTTVSSPKDSSQKKHPLFSWNELLDVHLIRLVIFSAFFSAFNGLCSSYMINIGLDRSISNISLYFTVNSISIILMRILCGNFVEKFKNIHYILLSTMFTACIGCIIIGASHTLWLFLLAAVIQAFSHGFAQPAVQAECIKRADPKRLGTASGTFFMSADLGQGLGIMIGGLTSDLFGYNGMFYILAAVFLLAIPSYVIINMRTKIISRA